MKYDTTAVVWKYENGKKMAFLVKQLQKPELEELKKKYQDSEDMEVQAFYGNFNLGIKEGASYPKGFDPLDW